MLTARTYLLLLLSILLGFTSADLQIRQENINDNGSFMCGKKMFFSRHVQESLKRASETHEGFIPYSGQLFPNYIGILWMLPLPTDPTKPTISQHKTRYFLVLESSELEVLGVVYRSNQGIYRHCTRGKAAGEITSITGANGGFQCQRDIITTKMAIEFANRARNLLLTSQNGLPGSYPITYTGRLEFQGHRPFTLWRMIKSGLHSSRGRYAMVLDRDLNVVGAFQTLKIPYVPCRELKRAEPEAKIMLPPIEVGAGEYDAFQCGSFTIKASKVQQDARGASDGFARKAQNVNNIYPKTYSGELLTTQNAPLFLWPVRMGDQNLQFPYTTIKEPFLAVVNNVIDIYGVVVKERTTGEYITCKRMSIRDGVSQ